MEVRGDEIMAGAGVSLASLIREAALLNLGGLECLVGIPATIGGALAMDCGTTEGTISQFVSQAYFLEPSGKLGKFDSNTGISTYQQLRFPEKTIILGCRLQLQRRPSANIQNELKLRLKLKRITQPLALASAGFIWKNPPIQYAGHLVEKVGLKGKRLNGAEISAKHPNFIVNRNGATATDILALMDMMHDRVYAQFGIKLEPEIKIIGE